MALPQPRQTTRYYHYSAFLLIAILCPVLLFQSCSHGKKVYESDCDVDVNFKKVSFRHLVDSIANYDQQYVEVSGKYVEDKALSALFSDSSITTASGSDALWVNFSQDCPLYLSGTHQGLFEYNDGQFTQINNKSVTIRGRINIHNKGSHNQCKAALDRVSLVKLY